MAFKKRPKLHNFSPSKEHIYKYKAVKNCFPPSEIPPTYLFLLSGSWTEAVVIPSSDRSTRINRISRIPKTWEHLTDWKTLLLWRISVIVKKMDIIWKHLWLEISLFTKHHPRPCDRSTQIGRIKADSKITVFLMIRKKDMETPKRLIIFGFTKQLESWEPLFVNNISFWKLWQLFKLSNVKKRTIIKWEQDPQIARTNCN